MMLSGVAAYSCRVIRTGAAHDWSSTYYVTWHAGVVFSNLVHNNFSSIKGFITAVWHIHTEMTIKS